MKKINDKILTKALVSKYEKRIKNENLISDIKFNALAKFNGAMEEIVETCLGYKIKIVKALPQKSINWLMQKGSRIDYLGKTADGKKVHIEMQKGKQKDVVLRNRVYQSAITIDSTKKGKKWNYKEVVPLISITICDFNPFENLCLDLPIYKVDRVIHGTDVIADNKVTEIYINLRAKSKDKKFNELVKILKDNKYKNDELFPAITNAKEIIIEGKVGGNKMEYTGVAKDIFKDGRNLGLEEGREKGREEGMKKGMINSIVNLVKKGALSIADGAEELKISQKKMKSLLVS